MRDLEWSRRALPVEPWWRIIVRAVDYIGEVALLTAFVGGVYYLSALIGAL
jgi:hypothetical protein